MKSPRADRLLVEDMLESLGRIARYTAGMQKGTFLSDRKTIDAVVRNLEIIGEAAASISASTQKSFGRSSPVICFNWAKTCISFSKAYPQTRRCLLLAANPTWGHTWHTLTLSLTSRTLTEQADGDSA